MSIALFAPFLINLTFTLQKLMSPIKRCDILHVSSSREYSMRFFRTFKFFVNVNERRIAVKLKFYFLITRFESRIWCVNAARRSLMDGT